MSTDLQRIQSASALRTWEESRAKQFGAWIHAVQRIIEGTREAFRKGLTRSQELDAFTRQRAEADRAYAAALRSPPPSVKKDQPGEVPQKKAAKETPVDKKGSVAEVKKEGAAQAVDSSPNPLIDVLVKLQKSAAEIREKFAASIDERSLLGGFSSTTEEYDRRGTELLLDLEAGLRTVVDAHVKATEAMQAYHRVSIEAGRKPKGSSTTEPTDDWLHEHRYRRTLTALEEKQNAFVARFCGAMLESRKLEEWREEMTKKMLGRYCTKLYQMETEVQSLANDGLKTFVGEQRRPVPPAVLPFFDSLLTNSATLPPDLREELMQDQPSSQTTESKEWPALSRLKTLSCLGKPPSSVLGLLAGPVKAPRRWYGSSVCMLVLTKDGWLHCFDVAQPKEKKNKSSPSEVGCAAATARAGPDKAADEPQWSIFVPGSRIISPVTGRSRCFEIEEHHKGWFGMRTKKKEIIQADTDEDLAQWTTALRKTCAGEGRPPPPEPPQQQTVPEAVPETVLETVPEAVPETVPETVPAAIPETVNPPPPPPAADERSELVIETTFEVERTEGPSEEPSALAAEDEFRQKPLTPQSVFE